MKAIFGSSMNRSILLSVHILKLLTGIIILATEVKSENPFKLLNLKYQIKNNYSKHWMNYIYKSIEISFSNVSDFSLHRIVDFLKIAKHQIHINNYIKCYDMKLHYLIKYDIHDAKYILYRFRGFGAITYKYDNKTLYPFNMFKISHHVWNFRPFKELKINIVFHRLKIHDYEYGSCMQNVTINSIYLSNNPGFMFCGDYSSFYLYPPWMQVYFNLFYDAVHYFKLDVTFDLMSVDVIYNILLPPEVHLGYNAIYIMKHLHVMLYTFFLKVPKYQHIFVRVNIDLSVRVYDI